MNSLITFDEISGRINDFESSSLSDFFESQPIVRGLIYSLVALGWEGTPLMLTDTLLEKETNKETFVETIKRLGYVCEEKKLNPASLKHVSCPCFIEYSSFQGILLDTDGDDYYIYDFQNNITLKEKITGTNKINTISVTPYSRMFREPPPESRDTTNWIKQCFNKYTHEIKNLLTLSFFISMFGAINPFFIMGVYNFALSSSSISTLFWLSLGGVTISIMEYKFKQLRMNILSSSGRELAIFISYHVTSKLLWLPFSMTSTAGVSSQLARLKDINQFRKLVTADSTLSYFDFPFIFIYIIAIVLLSGLAAITVVAGIVGMLIFCFYARTIYEQAIAKNSKANALVSYQWNEILTNLKSVQGLPLLQVIQSRFRSSHKQSIDDSENVAITNNRIQQLGQGFIQIIGTTSIVVAVITVLSGVSSPSSMIVIIILVWKALTPIMGIYNSLTRMKSIQSSSQQINALMSLSDDRQRLEKSPPINYIHGNMSIQGLSHRYPGASQGLTNLEFNITAGDKICISGPPGCGKSTLLKILSGIEEQYQGTITSEGFNIRQFNNYRYRSAVNFIPFNTHFFEGTLKDNFNLYNGHMLTKDMHEIIEQFQLNDYLDDGLNTLLNKEFLLRLPHGAQELLRLCIPLGNITQGIILIDEPLIGCSNQFSNIMTTLSNGPLNDKTLIFTSNEKPLVATSNLCLLLDNTGAQKYFGSPDKVLSTL